MLIELRQALISYQGYSMLLLTLAGHSAAGPGRGLELTQGAHKGRLLFIGHQGAYGARRTAGRLAPQAAAHP